MDEFFSPKNVNSRDKHNKGVFNYQQLLDQPGPSWRKMPGENLDTTAASVLANPQSWMEVESSEGMASPVASNSYAIPPASTQEPSTSVQTTLRALSSNPKLVPQLQNVVSTINVGCPLHLKRIALHARNSEYNPKQFRAVIMRIRSPRTTALIFSSGKVICTGAKTEDDSRLAARKFTRIINKLGFPAKFLEFTIHNIVGSCDMKFAVRLEKLAIEHGQFTTYEPELFPGLIYRMVRPKVVLLIFVSGKIVLTGAKVREELSEAFEKIYPVLKSFRK